MGMIRNTSNTLERCYTLLHVATRCMPISCTLNVNSRLIGHVARLAREKGLQRDVGQLKRIQYNVIFFVHQIAIVVVKEF